MRILKSINEYSAVAIMSYLVHGNEVGYFIYFNDLIFFSFSYFIFFPFSFSFHELISLEGYSISRFRRSRFNHHSYCGSSHNFF